MTILFGYVSRETRTFTKQWMLHLLINLIINSKVFQCPKVIMLDILKPALRELQSSDLCQLLRSQKGMSKAQVCHPYLYMKGPWIFCIIDFLKDIYRLHSKKLYLLLFTVEGINFR